HLFTKSGHKAWGGKGSGPAELQDPFMVAVWGNNVVVYDFELAKLVSYRHDGTFAGTRQVGAVNGFSVSETDTVVGNVDIMAETRRVLRLRGPHVDTLYEYRLPARIRLSAAGSPSYTVVTPYAPVPQWTILADGRLAIWDATRPHLEVRGLSDDPPMTFPLGAERYDVAPSDRELWLNEAIPSEFMGQRVFEPLRKEARRSVAFPEVFPPVLAIKHDPLGGAWVQRTTSASGEVWTLVGEKGVISSFHLPVGRKLLAVGRTELAVLARDADDLESVEMYRKPS
ncbi:MAG TPA: hypothetical protein VLK84_25255, partial [Longimicrobium sp.]|nr:hypothetical protein [Longimicrobium sp.]